MAARGQTLTHLKLKNSPFRGTARRARRAQQQRKGTPPALLLLAVFVLLVSVSIGVAVFGQTAVAAAALVLQAQRAINRQQVDLDPTVPLDADLPQTSTILARDGTVLAEVNDVRYGYRRSVPLSQISPLLPLATIAAEDRRFYEHRGVDPIGLVRALTQNAGSDGVASGASTLEMQLVRNVFFADEKTEQTLSRKLKEAIAAYQLDQHYSKSQVLQGYLNVVFYGKRAYGAEAASERYFGKSARDLLLPEAALLAGLPQSPSAYDPLLHYDLAKARQEHVLDLMANASFITPEERDAAKYYPLQFATQKAADTLAPHWVNYIEDAVREQFGPDALYTGGLRIQTTLDPEIQAMAERVVLAADGVRQQAHANNSSMVVMDPRNGQILAMVGSKNFFDPSIDGQVNVALAGRQPGSSIKPLVYLSGYERGLNPTVEVIDSRTAFSSPPGQPPYVPDNYESKFYGRITLRDALGNSLNVPAVKVLKYVGVAYFKGLARRFGISTLDNWDDRWLSLTLGGGEVKLLELTDAYTAIAREGSYVPAEPFLHVETSSGEVLHDADPNPAGTQEVDPRLAFQLLHGMGDPDTRILTYGVGTPLNLPRPSMVKTGTTDDFRDTWTMGCLPQVCVGVWMGNTNNAPMTTVSSSLTAGKIWVDMMHALIDRYQWNPDPWPVPDGVIITQVPNVGVSRPGKATHEEVFLPGNEQRYLLEMDWRKPD